MPARRDRRKRRCSGRPPRAAARGSRRTRGRRRVAPRSPTCPARARRRSASRRDADSAASGPVLLAPMGIGRGRSIAAATTTPRRRRPHPTRGRRSDRETWDSPRRRTNGRPHGGRHAPGRSTRPFWRHLGEGLGEAVGERLDHDRLVVVVVRLEARGDLVDRRARGDRRRRRRSRRRRLAAARRSRPGTGSACRRRRVRLLAQAREARDLARRALVGVDDDVVAVAVRRPEAVTRRAVSAASRRSASSSAWASRTARARPRRPPGRRGSSGTCPSAPR